MCFFFFIVPSEKKNPNRIQYFSTSNYNAFKYYGVLLENWQVMQGELMENDARDYFTVYSFRIHKKV